MNGRVINCEACGSKCYADTISLRGWCTECEKSFERVMAQRKASLALRPHCMGCGAVIFAGDQREGLCRRCHHAAR